MTDPEKDPREYCPNRLTCFVENSMGRVKGLLIILLAGILMTSSNFFFQWSLRESNTEISPMEIFMIRAIMQLLVIIPWMLSRGKCLRIAAVNDRLYVTVVGISGYLCMLFGYLSFDLIPLGDSAALSTTAPVFGALFAWLMLKEKCDRWDLLSGVFCIFGAVLVAKPAVVLGIDDATKYVFSHDHNTKTTYPALSRYNIGLAFCAASTVFQGLYYVSMSRVAARADMTWILFMPNMVALLLNPIPMAITNTLLRVDYGQRAWIGITSCALSSLVGHSLTVWALNLEKSTALLLVRNLDVVYAFLLQAVFLHIQPAWWSLLGAAIIGFAISGMFIARLKDSRPGIDIGGYQDLN